MTKQQRATLEQRIDLAIQQDAGITSADLAALIEEAVTAIAKAEQEGAPDQTLSLDPKAARQAIADATFAVNRLRTLLSRLQARYQQACEQERVNEYEAEARVLDDESIRLAEELRATYPAIEDKITDLFARIDAHRQRISALHQRRPAGVESVRDPELIARNLDGFDRERPSLLAGVHLVDWTSGREAWPLPRPSMAAAFAAAVPVYDRRCTADWAQDNELRTTAQGAERQRMADFYRRQDQEQEERENAEARESFLAQQERLTVNRPLKP
jgi:hypothetical protein